MESEGVATHPTLPSQPPSKPFPNMTIPSSLPVRGNTTNVHRSPLPGKIGKVTIPQNLNVTLQKIIILANGGVFNRFIRKVQLLTMLVG